MKTLKKESIKALSNLPEKSNVDDIMYRIYVLDKVRKGQEAVVKGKTISVDKLRKEVLKW